MIRAFFFAFVMFWAGSSGAQESSTASTPPKSDAAAATSAQQPDRRVSRNSRQTRKSASVVTRKEAVARKPDPKPPARTPVEDEPRDGDSSKREAAGSEDIAGELPDDLDSQSFGTGAEGGEAAVQEVNVLGTAAAGEERPRRVPMNVLFGGIGAFFVVLLTTAAVLEHLDLVKLRKMTFVQGERITTVNGRIDQQLSLLTAPIQDQVKQLKEKIEALERKNASMPHAPLVGRSYEHEAPRAFRAPLAAPPPPRFPALLSDVLAQSTSAMVRVKADPIDNDVFVPSHDGAFYLVPDGMAGLCIIPAHEPMTTQLYKTYYKSSYDCSLHGTGELYVVEPATVSARGDLWRLASRGKLEVRAS